MQNAASYDIYEMDTQEYPVVNLYRSQFLTLFTKPSRPYRRHRHTISMVTLQSLYIAIAGFLGGVAYYGLAEQPVYRVVSFAVIFIVWSTTASVTARKKPIDLMETVEHPALAQHGKIWQQKQGKVYLENTNVFLQAIKSSFVKQ